LASSVIDAAPAGDESAMAQAKLAVAMNPERAPEQFRRSRRVNMCGPSQ
jgi:hypothetical protein